jgi:hypothetical protein
MVVNTIAVSKEEIMPSKIGRIPDHYFAHGSSVGILILPSAAAMAVQF